MSECGLRKKNVFLTQLVIYLWAFGIALTGLAALSVFCLVTRSSARVG